MFLYGSPGQLTELLLPAPVSTNSIGDPLFNHGSVTEVDPHLTLALTGKQAVFSLFTVPAQAKHRVCCGYGWYSEGSHLRQLGSFPPLREYHPGAHISEIIDSLL